MTFIEINDFLIMTQAKKKKLDISKLRTVPIKNVKRQHTRKCLQII